jgi:hypothetical protein
VLRLPARGDAELREHLAQVPFGSARAEEELRADLGIGLSLAGTDRDPPLAPLVNGGAEQAPDA